MANPNPFTVGVVILIPENEIESQLSALMQPRVPALAAVDVPDSAADGSITLIGVVGAPVFAIVIELFVLA